jgi:PIN domain nuclease of toxin-antitoxin system
MSPEQFVLDASALLTLVEDEAGADWVQEVIAENQLVLPWVALPEMTHISHGAGVALTGD